MESIDRETDLSRLPRKKRDIRNFRRATLGKLIRQTETRLTWLMNPETTGPITGPRNGAML